MCDNRVRINCSVCGKDRLHKKCKWPIIVLHGFYGRAIIDTGGPVAYPGFSKGGCLTVRAQSARENFT